MLGKTISIDSAEGQRGQDRSQRDEEQTIGIQHTRTRARVSVELHWRYPCSICVRERERKQTARQDKRSREEHPLEQMPQ